MISFAGYDWDLGVVAAFVASAAAIFSTFVAQKISRRNANVSKVLELMKLKQTWVNEVRNEASNFMTYLSKNETDAIRKKDNIYQLKLSHSKLSILLPFDDPDTLPIIEMMGIFVAAGSIEEMINNDGTSPSDFIRHIQLFIRKENEKLESYLEKL